MVHLFYYKDGQRILLDSAPSADWLEGKTINLAIEEIKDGQLTNRRWLRDRYFHRGYFSYNTLIRQWEDESTNPPPLFYRLCFRPRKTNKTLFLIKRSISYDYLLSNIHKIKRDPYTWGHFCIEGIASNGQVVERRWLRESYFCSEWALEENQKNIIVRPWQKPDRKRGWKKRNRIF